MVFFELLVIHGPLIYIVPQKAPIVLAIHPVNFVFVLLALGFIVGRVAVWVWDLSFRFGTWVCRRRAWIAGLG